jgi:predicted ribosomally synthesized peptide with SipW-like signal peptide
MPTHAIAPVLVQERPRRRRYAGLAGALTLGVALVAGATMAAFTDSEYADLFDRAGGGGFNTATYNIQISATGDANDWHDTTLIPQTSDNTPADIESPLALSLVGDDLIPGDANRKVSTVFHVRNDPSTTSATNLTLKFIKDSDPKLASDSALVDLLRFTVKLDDTTVITGTSLDEFGEIDRTPLVLGANLPKGTEIKVEVSMTLADAGSSAANAALQGKQAYLLAQVDGTSA